MSVLDDIAAALRARTKTRVYGTPFADEKLAQLATEQQARDVGLKQAQFNLDEDQQMAPIRREVQQSLVHQRGATTENTQERTKGLEFNNSPEMQDLKRRQAEITLDIVTNKDKRAAEKHKPELDLIQARIAHLNRPSTAGSPKPPSYTFKEGADGNLYAFNPKDPSAAPILAGAGSTAAPPTTPGAAPVAGPTTPQGFQPKKSSAELNETAPLKALIADMNRLEQLAADPKVNSYFGVGVGQLTKATRGYRDLDPKVQEAFRLAQSALVTKLRQISGGAVTPSEAARLEPLLPNPGDSASKFASDLKAFRRELSNSVASRRGQPLQGAVQEPGSAEQWIRDPATGKLRRK
jgi:hypothetical protein